ncbi:hypothetical protein F8O07_03805 [Pseudoclavibacter sp. CFCC 13796]|uniref:hypothetical protein n=1 Tax=Pseudoclavibacter sp. CFCC 13796 TaxID=2615179 RepID=UPI001301927E|nr:hypothetical protein [Pseudoclavibacter sp. CFCC 13796]KAB1661091.1 hypothetical protein F8O07_03805 [Pseudoclavibacter sp. CFCC 13796]
MTENNEKAGLSRRTIIKAGAWAAPVVAIAAAAPMSAAASTDPLPEATSIGATTTSPFVNEFGRIEVFGQDATAEDGFFPTGQIFTLTSADLDFNAIVTSITGGTITPSGANTWIITPNSGANIVKIRFSSPVPGSYSVSTSGPATGGPWGGNVSAKA